MKYKFELSIMSAAFLVLSLAGVASADSVVKTLYVDGVKVGTSTAAQALSFPYPRLTIGSEGSRYYRYNGLVGEIDEFAVFGRVLTDTNVADLFNAGQGGYVTAVTNANPLLYLRFEDANSNEGSKIANSGSLADVNSTYIGAVGQDASGYVGKSAILHGTSGGTGDCMDVCDWDARLSKVDISVAFWVKTTQSSDYPRLFQHNGGNTEQRSYGAMLYPAGPNSIGLIGGGSTGTVTRAINDGQWHHIVVTFNSLQPGPYAAEVMADDPCVYLKFDQQLPLDSSENGYVAGLGADTNIGTTAGTMGNSSLYIDQKTQYAFAYVWNNWYDCASLGVPWPCGHRYRQDSPIPPYPRNDGYRFGVDPLNPDATSHITLEIWVKANPLNLPEMYSTIFQQTGSWQREANAPYIGCSGNDPNTSTLRVGTGWEMWYTGVKSPLDGNWHQIVVTYDENELSDMPGHDMTVQLYVDGTLRGARVAVADINHPGACRIGTPDMIDEGGGPMNGAKNTLIIGGAGDRWFVCNAWRGWVDEFALYGSVLSADRIAMHYAAWQPKDCAEVWARGLGMPGDLNHDCVVDFYDYAIFASEWRLCNNPGGAGCSQNW